MLLCQLTTFVIFISATYGKAVFIQSASISEYSVKYKFIINISNCIGNMDMSSQKGAATQSLKYINMCYLISEQIISSFLTGNDTEILQIAATDGADAFEVYILPTRPISPSASSVNKLTLQHGILFYNSHPVRAVPLADGLSKMISWLKPKAPCLLIAHNCKSFDGKHLIKALESTEVDKEFSAIVSGFSDTLPAFKELLPQRKSYSQENLVRDILHCSYEAHNATADVQSLNQLVNKFLNTELLRKHSFHHIMGQRA